MRDLTPLEILKLPMQNNDAGAKTIRGYLKALLKELIEEEEGFSGKRPFGNSGWICDLETPLVKAGLVKGKIAKRGGCLVECDSEAAEKLIQAAVEAL